MSFGTVIYVLSKAVFSTSLSLENTARCRSELENKLTKEQNDLPEKMMDSRNEYECLAETEAFACGL